MALPVAVRGQAARLLGQLGGGARRAPRPRPPGGLVQRGGHPGVRRVGGEREVPGAFLGVVEHPGEAAVQVAPAGGGSCA
jgi:hypothetical protein